MVTAELAAVLPVLVLVVAVAVSAVAVVAAHVRLEDAAREAARASARGDGSTALRLAAEQAPNATVRIERSGDDVRAVVTEQVAPLGHWLPPVTVTEQAVAAVEPSGDDP